jgi:hypothetical protein
MRIVVVLRIGILGVVVRVVILMRIVVVLRIGNGVQGVVVV